MRGNLKRQLAATWLFIGACASVHREYSHESVDGGGGGNVAGASGTGGASCLPNPCGGCLALPHLKDSACTEKSGCPGIYQCSGSEAVVCSDTHPENACGGCSLLAHQPGDVCLEDSGCTGSWLCSGTDAVACSNTHPLNTYYRDADADGVGDPALSEASCFAPSSGWVTNSDDCCDKDDAEKTGFSTHPGQTAWFSAPNACGSYDYNCKDGEELGSTAYFDGCVTTSAGWYPTVPGCGESGAWLTMSPCGSQPSSDTKTQECH